MDQAITGDRLLAAYTGPLAEAEPPRLAASPPAGSVSAADLLEAPRLRSMLDAFATASGYDDPRGSASQWSKWYFNTLVVPAVIANLLLDCDLPADACTPHFVLSEDSRAARLVLPDTLPRLRRADPIGRFRTLIDTYVTAMASALAEAVGLSPRVFLSNAGNVFEYTATVLSNHPNADATTVAPATELMARARLDDGRRNPLHRPVWYRIPEPTRVRRLCCMRYLVADLDYCGNCPLAVPSSRDDPENAIDSDSRSP